MPELRFMSANALHKIWKISDIARTGACWNFLRFSSRWLWQSRYVLRGVKNSKGLGFIGIEYIQYLWTKSFFKQLTLRSTFCQRSPARESKKAPRALSVSMQICFKFCATFIGQEISRFRHLRIRLPYFLTPQQKLRLYKIWALI